MDVDFDSPVNVERPPAPLTFDPDPQEPALPSSPPRPPMPFPLDPTNHQHNSQQQLSQSSLQLQVSQVEGVSAPATTTTTDPTAQDQSTLSNQTADHSTQLDGASAGETTPAEAPADDNAMDTSPDNNDAATNQPNDTPHISNPEPSQLNPDTDSQLPTAANDNPPANPAASDAQTNEPVPEAAPEAAPVDPEQPTTASEVPPPQTDAWNQGQAIATNAEVDADDQDDSSSEVSDDQGNDESQEEHVYWADIEEDTSTPSEEELKELAENPNREYNAHDCEFSQKYLLLIK